MGIHGPKPHKFIGFGDSLHELRQMLLSWASKPIFRSSTQSRRCRIPCRFPRLAMLSRLFTPWGAVACFPRKLLQIASPSLDRLFPRSLRHRCVVRVCFSDARATSKHAREVILHANASGPAIGLPGRILGGLLPGRHRNRPSGRPKAGRRADFSAFRPEGRFQCFPGSSAA